MLGFIIGLFIGAFIGCGLLGLLIARTTPKGPTV